MTTLDLQVSAGNDDAHEADDGTNFSYIGGNLRCEANTAAGSRYNAGMRFQNVAVPNGAIINTSYVSVIFIDTTHDSPDLDYRGEAADDADDFVTTQDVTDRTRTSASVNWSDTDLGGSSFVDGPEIKTIIQEIVNRAGWSSGNNMVIFADGENAAAQESGTRFVSYNTSSSNAPKLHIEYTEGKTLPLLKPKVGYIPTHQLQL